MSDKIFYASCFGLILGVLLRSFVFVNLYFAILVAILALGLILFTYFTKLKWGIIISIYIFSAALGIFRFHIASEAPPDVFESKIGQTKLFEGVITDEPDIRENSQKLTIEIISGKEKTKILATVGLDQDFKYGDGVNLYGKLSKPENFTTDQGKEFDYINYLRKDGIFYVVNYAHIDVASQGNGNSIKSILFSVKEKFLDKIN